MSSWKYAVLILTLLVAVSVPIICLHGGSEPEEYGIEYELNGGSFAGDFPESYTEGTYTPLCVPQRDGMHFRYWCTDEDLTDPVMGILPSVSGDLKLYASWGEHPLTGLGFVCEVTSCSGGSVDASGSMDYITRACSGGEYYVEQSYSMTDVSGSDRAFTAGRWTDEDTGEDQLFLLSEEVAGTMFVENDCGDSTQWIADGYILMKLVPEDPGNGMSMVFGGTYKDDQSAEMHMDVSHDFTLSVEGDLDVRIGDAVTLTARGDGFHCWSVGDSFVFDRVLSVDRIDPGIAIDALADNFDILDSDVLDPEALGFPEDAVVRDSDGKQVSVGHGTVRLGPGMYAVSSSENGTGCYRHVMVEQGRTFTAVWEHGGREYSLSLDMLLSEVCLDDYLNHGWNTRFFINDLKRYASPSHSFVPELSAMLSVMGEGMDGRELADFVLGFVQSIPYATDAEISGEEEYFMYPGETLWEGRGDCEDTSVLYAALMSSIGYDSCLMVLEDHVMAGIVLEDVSGDDSTYAEGGRTYVMAETVSDWDLGSTSPGRGPDEVRYVQVVGGDV